MKKKFIIVGGIVIVAIATIILLVLSFNKKITISFDTDGAKAIKSVEIKKGESIKLPKISKDGYVFNGWYLKGKKVSESTTYDKDVTLKAKWISEEAKTFVVTFDTDGGSKIDDITVVCDEKLVLPTSPTKTGYTFVSWVDSSGKEVKNNDVLTCKDVTLKATWKKEEKKKETTKKQETKTTTKEETKVETKKEEKKITYSCPSGYTLDGTKCTKVESVEADKSCSRGTVSGSDCVRELSDQEPTWTCPDGYGLASGYTPSGNRVCTRYSSTQEITPTCPRSYSYDSTSHMCKANGAAVIGKVNYSCSDSSYTLNGDKCTKQITIDATAN